MKVNITKSLFGEYLGQTVYEYTLHSEQGITVKVLNLGGIITEIDVKDKHGIAKNVVLGYNRLEDYIGNGAYAGALVGRTAGRIAGAQFTIDGTTYHLAKNNGENAIHGGVEGLTAKVFAVKELPNGIELTYTSPDGEEGYPAKVDFKVQYTLTAENTLCLTYEAIADKKTYLNLTNHSYFNLAGDLETNGDTQVLTIDADRLCELREGLIPTGKLLEVAGTTFDLRAGKVIAEGIAEGHPQFEITRAYDHPFVLNRSGLGGTPQLSLYSPHSGIELKVFTTQRVAVVYTGNFLDEVLPFDRTVSGAKHTKNARFLGVAIEMQDFPNGINEPAFDVQPLEKGAIYKQQTLLQFDVKTK